ncbi:DUF29 domain-containing protein [Pasteurellaceae bacterium USgator11]|nr:DUF29 domain-containing protein [Pasteurellaceae bacterium UScroc12]TNG97514.1 DUF29 domain-containing protein [Pasteurellaceae bacterium USgator41]TNG99416.1 DUF29 domain-containing protein [Pasteurellaceae bacterium UScroc31]TNH00475.1 DUF29 domain-containing protein [Pasteurellaceae bacterium USgator11]
MSIGYNEDFYGWVNDQARLLKDGAFNQLDLENLIEEIECMGRSELSALRSRLKVLIMHLLKWKYQPTYQGRSWQLTIAEQRNEIEGLLDDSPSLKHKLANNDTLLKCWKLAVLGASKETGFEVSHFPTSPIWTLDEILNPDFLP